ncbi:hypothetical protein V5740_04680 [Croceibacterium sp. TMG7-5b_MA50]|uniref:hypothetical protein n=1 Tax=Croceibacterium sp. TMG7-5b_MA50 TaxID=3121290 RepID=UPI0032217F6B
MSETLLISLVAIVGWLVLVTQSGHLRQMGARRMCQLAGIWAGIFAIVVLTIQLLNE